MGFKRYPGKNGSLQRNWEKAERREWKAYDRMYKSKKMRIQQKACKTFLRANQARRAYVDHCNGEN